MDIRVLKYFLAVAREQNITRAAESLHIAQPSLSKQMMELEKELGKQISYICDSITVGLPGTPQSIEESPNPLRLVLILLLQPKNSHQKEK